MSAPRQALPEETPFDGVPYAGCAATVHYGSDSYPATVVRVGKTMVGQIPRTVEIREDDAEVTGGSGQDGSATYTCYEEPNYPVLKFSWRARLGRYVQVGAGSGLWISFGWRRCYLDPSF